MSLESCSVRAPTWVGTPMQALLRFVLASPQRPGTPPGVDLELEVRHVALCHGPLELGQVHVGVRVAEFVGVFWVSFTTFSATTLPAVLSCLRSLCLSPPRRGCRRSGRLCAASILAPSTSRRNLSRLPSTPSSTCMPRKGTSFSQGDGERPRRSVMSACGPYSPFPTFMRVGEPSPRESRSPRGAGSSLPRIGLPVQPGVLCRAQPCGVFFRQGGRLAGAVGHGQPPMTEARTSLYCSSVMR